VRLFLALEPPAELRDALGRLGDIAQARCGGRRMPTASLHLTLAFLGEVDETQVPALRAWVAERPIAAATWQLDTWGTFQRPAIVWVGGQAPDARLIALHQAVWDGLAAFGFNDRPARFVPHVTLLRRAQRLATSELPAVDLTWPYQQLSLVHSSLDHQGARYTTLARSPIA